MGEVIQSSSIHNTDCLIKPIVYIDADDEIISNAISLNLPIAKSLMQINERMRTFRLEAVVSDAIGSLPANSTIKEFDVLFNPSYKVDALQVLINVCKKKPFSIVWPGEINASELIYSEPGLKDYHTYEIDNYDVTCIIEERKL